MEMNFIPGQDENLRTSGSSNLRFSSPAVQGFRELFLNVLNDIYSAENALLRAIPTMVDNATSPELAYALTQHLEVTNQQILRLEIVFNSMGENAELQKSEAMKGLLSEAEEIMAATEAGVLRDAAIILAAQKVEHYEIACYGALCSFASNLGEDEIASLLAETLTEEKAADEYLTEIAESVINLQAAARDRENNMDYIH